MRNKAKWKSFRVFFIVYKKLMITFSTCVCWAWALQENPQKYRTKTVDGVVWIIFILYVFTWLHRLLFPRTAITTIFRISREHICK